MSAPRGDDVAAMDGSFWVGVAVAVALSVPIYGAVVVWWLLSQPLAWWLVS